MRLGIGVSAIGHLAIFAFAFFAFPEARPLTADDVEALPVDLVEVGDVRDLLAGDKNSKVVPVEKPQPKPNIKAETPSPKPPEEKPADKPVEAARQPEARPVPPPEPKAEPKPEPEPEQVAALPDPKPAAPEPPPDEEAVPDAAAVPQEQAPRPVDARKPRARPTPPKQVAQPKPQVLPEPKQVVHVKPAKDFNPDDITALLNKQQPTGGGAPDAAHEPQTIGSIDGHANAAMTQSEIDALKAKLYACWQPPLGVRDAGALVVTVRISLLQDGTLAGPPQLISISSASNPLGQVAAESAIRAVAQCAPFGDILRPEKYALWNQIDFVFDPREMLGG